MGTSHTSAPMTRDRKDGDITRLSSNDKGMEGTGTSDISAPMTWDGGARVCWDSQVRGAPAAAAQSAGEMRWVPIPPSLSSSHHSLLRAVTITGGNCKSLFSFLLYLLSLGFIFKCQGCVPAPDREDEQIAAFKRQDRLGIIRGVCGYNHPLKHYFPRATSPWSNICYFRHSAKPQNASPRTPGGSKISVLAASLPQPLPGPFKTQAAMTLQITHATCPRAAGPASAKRFLAPQPCPRGCSCTSQRCRSALRAPRPNKIMFEQQTRAVETSAPLIPVSLV